MDFVLNRPLFKQGFQEGGEVEKNVSPNILSNLNEREKEIVATLFLQGFSLEDAVKQVEEMKFEKRKEDVGSAPLAGAAIGTGIAALDAQKSGLFDKIKSSESAQKLGRFGKNLGRFAFSPQGALAAIGVGMLTGESDSDILRKVLEEKQMDEFFTNRDSVSKYMPRSDSISSKEVDIPAVLNPRKFNQGGLVEPSTLGIGSMQEQGGIPSNLLTDVQRDSANEMEKVGTEYVGEVLSSIEGAEEPVEMINAIRGNERPIEERYRELASIVGPEDAAATPETVLTLVQPTLMMTEQGAIDSGIGQMVRELTEGAEMIGEAGEPTDMGMGMGNLMMQGAEQPAMLSSVQNYGVDL